MFLVKYIHTRHFLVLIVCLINVSLKQNGTYIQDTSPFSLISILFLFPGSSFLRHLSPILKCYCIHLYVNNCQMLKYLISSSCALSCLLCLRLKDGCKQRDPRLHMVVLSLFMLQNYFLL